MDDKLNRKLEDKASNNEIDQEEGNMNNGVIGGGIEKNESKETENAGVGNIENGNNSEKDISSQQKTDTNINNYN